MKMRFARFCVLAVLLSLALSSVFAAPQVLMELGHSGPIAALAYSPDGKLLASASSDATVRVWDENGAWQSTLSVGDGTSDPITALAFSLDGKLLAVGSRNGVVRLWRVPEKSGVYSKAPAPLKFGDGTVLRKGAKPEEKPSAAQSGDEAITSLAFSPDGKLLAATGYRGHTEYSEYNARVRVWDVASGESKWTQSFSDSDEARAFFADGSTLVVARAPNIVQHFDDTGQTLETIVLPEQIASRRGGLYTAFSPDGASFIVKGPDDYKIYDTQTGQVKATLEANPVAVDPAAANRRREMAERITGRPVPERTGPAASPANRLGEAAGATFSADGKNVAIVFAQGGARIWDAMSGKETSFLQTRARSNGTIALSPRGVVALGEATAKITLWQNAALQTTLSRADNAVQALEFYERAGAPMLLVGYEDGALAWWNLRTRKIEKVSGTTGRGLTALAVSPDGSTLAAAGYLKTYSFTMQENGIGRGELQVLDLNDNNKTLWSRQDAGRSTLSRLKFSRDGRQLWLSSQGGPSMTRAGAIEGAGFQALEILDARSGEALETVTLDERVGAADALELSHDETKLAIYGNYDVRVWDLPAGKLRLRLNSSGFEGSLLALSPTGNHLAIAHPRGDGGVRLWDVTKERNTGRGRGNDDADIRLRAASKDVATPKDVAAPAIRALEYSSGENARLIAGDARGRVLFWDAALAEKDATPATVLQDELATAVTAMRALPMNRRRNDIVATGHADGTVRIWAIQTKQLLATLLLIPKPVATPAVVSIKNPAGDALSLENFEWIVWTPEGYFDATPNAEKLLRWREGELITPAPSSLENRRVQGALPKPFPLDP